MKRNLSFFAILLASLLFMTSCSLTGDEISYIPSQPEADAEINETSETDANSDLFELELIGKSHPGNTESFFYYRESVTDIMFIQDTGSSNSYLATIPDPETGLPLTYTRYMELYEAKEGN